MAVQLVVAIIGCPQEPHHSRRCRQLPSMGALRKSANTQKPLLEERCHEVTEWWHGGTISSGNHRSLEQVWWHTKIRKEIRNL